VNAKVAVKSHAAPDESGIVLHFCWKEGSNFETQGSGTHGGEGGECGPVEQGEG